MSSLLIWVNLNGGREGDEVTPLLLHTSECAGWQLVFSAWRHRMRHQGPRLHERQHHKLKSFFLFLLLVWFKVDKRQQSGGWPEESVVKHEEEVELLIKLHLRLMVNSANCSWDKPQFDHSKEQLIFKKKKRLNFLLLLLLNHQGQNTQIVPSLFKPNSPEQKKKDYSQ